MNRRHHDQPRAAQREPINIVVSARKGWAVSTVTENGIEVVELRQLIRHANGNFTPTKHRSVFRRESLPALVAALAALHAERR